VIVTTYESGQAQAWDEFCASAVNSTFIQTRRFLSYHGDRFTDASLILRENDRIIGVCPSAVDPADARVVTSHPGVTYGGLIHGGRLRGAKMLQAMELVADHYASRGFNSFRYKALPYIYGVTPAQDDLYALFRLKAIRYRCDLSCAIDLSNRLPKSERRRRSLKKAQAAVTVSGDVAVLPDIWRVLEKNLLEKHQAKPAHSLEDISLLIRMFPHNIKVYVACLDGAVQAGILAFVSPKAYHAQYIASSEKGYAVCALDAVFEKAIDDAVMDAKRYFDFGTSNEDAGRILNEGLYQFKSEFGGAGVAHEYYELSL
jgi:hypothetical protein